MSDLGKIVGSKIKQKRNELGCTQDELGKILGCTFQSIQHYEKGNCEMPIYMLIDFASLCQLPIDWFFVDDKSLYNIVYL